MLLVVGNLGLTPRLTSPYTITNIFKPNEAVTRPNSDRSCIVRQQSVRFRHDVALVYSVARDCQARAKRGEDNEGFLDGFLVLLQLATGYRECASKASLLVGGGIRPWPHGLLAKQLISGST